MAAAGQERLSVCRVEEETHRALGDDCATDELLCSLF